jgi:hypothetical protein
MTAIDEDDLARGPSQCHGKHARRTNGARTDHANLHDDPSHDESKTTDNMTNGSRMQDRSRHPFCRETGTNLERLLARPVQGAVAITRLINDGPRLWLTW